MSLWYTEEFEGRLRVGLRALRTLFSEQSELQRVEIFETELFGRVLAIDGILMTSVRDEKNYHELLVQPALCTAPVITNVLIVGGGDGGSAREVLRHPEVERCVLVEIDRMVVEASKLYLPQIGTAWEDPRLEVRIEDGVAFVRDAAPESFDVVILDGSDPVGPAEALFGERFHQDVARLLPPEGVFALQSESPLLFEKVFFDVQASLRRAFGRAFPYFRAVPLYGTGSWSWTYASRKADPMRLVEARLERIEAESEIYNREVHQGVFAVPQWIRRRLDAL